VVALFSGAMVSFVGVIMLIAGAELRRRPVERAGQTVLAFGFGAIAGTLLILTLVIVVNNGKLE